MGDFPQKLHCAWEKGTGWVEQNVSRRAPAPERAAGTSTGVHSFISWLKAIQSAWHMPVSVLILGDWEVSKTKSLLTSPWWKTDKWNQHNTHYQTVITGMQATEIVVWMRVIGGDFGRLLGKLSLEWRPRHKTWGTSLDCWSLRKWQAVPVLSLCLYHCFPK